MFLVGFFHLVENSSPLPFTLVLIMVLLVVVVLIVVLIVLIVVVVVLIQTRSRNGLLDPLPGPLLLLECDAHECLELLHGGWLANDVEVALVELEKAQAKAMVVSDDDA